MSKKRKKNRQARQEHGESINKTPRKGVDPGYKPVSLSARTDNQRKLIMSIVKNDITFASGPAGTGKTHVAVAMAVQMIKEGTLKKLILTRPLVSVGKDMGFLPGGIMEKVGPYITPCFDELNTYLSLSMIGQWINDKRIEVVPLSVMRGRTFKDSFVFLDEAQNATHEEMKNFLTRIGTPSRYCISGDPTQSDLIESQRGAFSEAIRRLDGMDGFGHMILTEDDIVRHRLIGDIIRRLW